MKTNAKKLFEQLYVPLVSFVEEIIEDHEEARNIVVEVFRQNLTELESYGCPGDLTEVILVFQKKALIESFCFLRERNKFQEEVEEAEVKHFADYVDSVEQTLIVKEMWCQISKKAGLSQRQQLAMELFFLGVRNAAAADLMNISASTYRVTIHKAIKKYKLALKIGGFLMIVILVTLSANAH